MGGNVCFDTVDGLFDHCHGGSKSGDQKKNNISLTSKKKPVNYILCVMTLKVQWHVKVDVGSCVHRVSDHPLVLTLD